MTTEGILIKVKMRGDIQRHPLLARIDQAASNHVPPTIDEEFLMQFHQADWEIQAEVIDLLGFVEKWVKPQLSLRERMQLLRSRTLRDLWQREHGEGFVTKTLAGLDHQEWKKDRERGMVTALYKQCKQQEQKKEEDV